MGSDGHIFKKLSSTWNAAAKRKLSKLCLESQPLATDSQHASVIRALSQQFPYLHDLSVYCPQGRMHVDAGAAHWGAASLDALAERSELFPQLRALSFGLCPQLGLLTANLNDVLVAYGTKLQELDLAETDLAGDPLSSIVSTLCESTPGLTSLRLSGNTAIQSEDLRELSGLKKLQKLMLDRTSIDSRVLEYLPGQLKVLLVSGCQYLTDSAIEKIHPLTEIEMINVSRSRLGVAGRAILAELPSLRVLQASQCVPQVDRAEAVRWQVRRSELGFPPLEDGEFSPDWPWTIAPSVRERIEHVRFVLLGSVDAGKTALADAVFRSQWTIDQHKNKTYEFRLISNDPSESRNTGIVSANWDAHSRPGVPLGYTVFDFGGEEYLAGIHETAMWAGPERTVFVIVLDGTRRFGPNERRELQSLIRLTKRHHHDGDPPVVIVESKCDFRVLDAETRRAAAAEQSETLTNCEYVSGFMAAEKERSNIAKDRLDKLRAVLLKAANNAINDAKSSIRKLSTDEIKLYDHLAHTTFPSRPRILETDFCEIAEDLGLELAEDSLGQVAYRLSERGHCFRLKLVDSERQHVKSLARLGNGAGAGTSRALYRDGADREFLEGMFSVRLIKEPLYELAHKAAFNSTRRGYVPNNDLRSTVLTKLPRKAAKLDKNLMDGVIAAVERLLTGLGIAALYEDEWCFPHLLPSSRAKVDSASESGILFWLPSLPGHAVSEFVGGLLDGRLIPPGWELIKPVVYSDEIALRYHDVTRKVTGGDNRFCIRLVFRPDHLTAELQLIGIEERECEQPVLFVIESWGDADPDNADTREFLRFPLGMLVGEFCQSIIGSSRPEGEWWGLSRQELGKATAHITGDEANTFTSLSEGDRPVREFDEPYRDSRIIWKKRGDMRDASQMNQTMIKTKEMAIEQGLKQKPWSYIGDFLDIKLNHARTNIRVWVVQDSIAECKRLLKTELVDAPQRYQEVFLRGIQNLEEEVKRFRQQGNDKPLLPLR